MSYKRLGNYLRIVDVRNTNAEVTNLLGINITKRFMPSVANTSETDLSKYKIIKKGQFAYSPMQVGRDETIRIALYEQDLPAIISPAYLVLEVKNSDELLPEFLMMWFLRSESDRYGWFISDSSVRASLEWERLCDISVPIPNIEIQRSYAAIYSGLLRNKQAYEESLNDIQLICDSYIQELIKTQESKSLGDYIEQSDERNSDLKIDNLLGISVDKIFIDSRSNKDGLDLQNYKVVRPREFAYVSVTSRNGEKISIALLDGNAGLVSSTYVVFRVKDISQLLPEYLLLWFSRAEFDRYARFHSWGSARETFNWDDMCDVKLPIPDIKVQEAIVTLYHTLQARRRINRQLDEAIKPLCPVLIKGATEHCQMEAVNS